MRPSLSAELVALTPKANISNTVTYKIAPPSWSRTPAELVALYCNLPPSWSRFSAEWVAPYIEQNITEHSLQNIFQKFQNRQHFSFFVFLKQELAAHNAIKISFAVTA